MALRPLHIIELCAGAGGLGLGIELAAELAGYRARGVAYVEREAAAAALLATRMDAGELAPAPIWSDLATFDARPWRGVVHCVASGDPCQPNSVAGKRQGAADDRFLINQVLRVVDECRPDRVFRENVPGNADGQLGALVPPLEAMGYRVAAGIFSSSATGNTMRRERLFVMADRAGKRCGEAGRDSGRSAKRAGERCGALGGASSARLLPAALAGANQEDESPRLRDAQPERRGRGVASPESVGWRQGRPEHAWQQRRSAVAVASGELGSANRTDAQGRRRGGDARRRQEPSRHAGLAGGGLERPAIIPGPTDSRWIDVLDRWPELQPALSQEEAQSHLRRGFDALANRVDRLRMLGNGVDPVAAAYAWLSLDALLASDVAAGSVVVRSAA